MAKCMLVRLSPSFRQSEMIVAVLAVGVVMIVVEVVAGEVAEVVLNVGHSVFLSYLVFKKKLHSYVATKRTKYRRQQRE